MTSKNIIMGVFNYCPSAKIPADSVALAKILSFIPPNLFHVDVLETYDDDLYEMMQDGFVTLSCPRFDKLILHDSIGMRFDESMFDDLQLDCLKDIGRMLPSMFKRNESARFKKYQNYCVS